MSNFSVDDYLGALQGLMPTGRVWNRDSDSVQTAVLMFLANSFYQSGSDALALLADSFPSTATTMLPEWESSLGLPDDCTIGEMQSITQRQLAVKTKLATAGGQSVQHFIDAAAALGYAITVTEYRPARAGLSRAGSNINGNDWRWTWKVTAPDTTITYAKAGASYAGDPLDSWGNKLLECRLRDMSPSHTNLLIAYKEAITTS